MRARLLSIVIVAGVALVPLVGCGGDDGGAPTADGSTTTSEAAGSTSSTAAATATTAPGDGAPDIGHETDGDTLLDGKHFGYITELIAGHNLIVGKFDLAELYTGDAAVAEAAKDGGESEGDFYIRNENPKERAIDVDAEAEVLDVDYDACCDPFVSNAAQFVADRDAKGETRTAAYITIQAGKVTRIEELYFP